MAMSRQPLLKLLEIGRIEPILVAGDDARRRARPEMPAVTRVTLAALAKQCVRQIDILLTSAQQCQRVP